MGPSETVRKMEMSAMEQTLGAMQKQMERLKVLDLIKQRYQREEELRTARLEKVVVEDTPLSGRIDGSLFYGLESVEASRGHPNQREERLEPLTQRVEMPMFDGSNAKSWVLRVDQ